MTFEQSIGLAISTSVLTGMGVLVLRDPRAFSRVFPYVASLIGLAGLLAAIYAWGHLSGAEAQAKADMDAVWPTVDKVHVAFADFLAGKEGVEIPEPMFDALAPIPQPTVVRTPIPVWAWECWALMAVGLAVLRALKPALSHGRVIKADEVTGNQQHDRQKGAGQ